MKREKTDDTIHLVGVIDPHRTRQDHGAVVITRDVLLVNRLEHFSFAPNLAQFESFRIVGMALAEKRTRRPVSFRKQATLWTP